METDVQNQTTNKIINQNQQHFDLNTKHKKRWADNPIAKYLMVFILFMVQASGFAISQNIQPTLVVGASNTLYNGNTLLFTLMFTVSALGSSLMQPFLAKLYAKLNIKLIFCIGSLISGGFMMMTGFTAAIFQAKLSSGVYSTYLYVCQIIVQGGTMLFSGLGIPFLIGAWLPPKQRNVALGICMAGASVGNIMWQPIVIEALKWDWLKTFGIENSQWAGCYFFFGAISVVVMLAISIIFIYNPKLTYKTQQNVVHKKVLNDVKIDGAGVMYTIRLPHFWVLLVGYFIFAVGITGFAVFFNTFLLSNFKGTSAETYIAISASMFGVGCLVGNIIGGFLFTKLGVAWTMFLGAGSRMIACFLFFLSIQTPVLAPIATFIVGLSVYTYTSCSAVMSYDLFGKKDNLTVLAYIGIAFAIGYAVSNPIYSGILGDIQQQHDLFGHTVNGNWAPVMILMIVMLAVGAVIMLFSIVIIKRKGYQGILEYSRTKYNWVIMPYQLKIWFSAFIIWLTKKDFRLSNKYQDKYQIKATYWKQNVASKLLEKNKIWYDKEITKANKLFDAKQEKINQQINELNKVISDESYIVETKQIKKIKDKIQLIEQIHTKEKNAEIAAKLATQIQKLNSQIKHINDKALNVLKLKITKLNKKLATVKLNAKITIDDINNANLRLNKFYANKYEFINELISKQIFDRYLIKMLNGSHKLSYKAEKLSNTANRMLSINELWTEQSALEYIHRYDYELIKEKDFFEKWIYSKTDELSYNLYHKKEDTAPTPTSHNYHE